MAYYRCVDEAPGITDFSFYDGYGRLQGCYVVRFHDGTMEEYEEIDDAMDMAREDGITDLYISEPDYDWSE